MSPQFESHLCPLCSHSLSPVQQLCYNNIGTFSCFSGENMVPKQTIQVQEDHEERTLSARRGRPPGPPAAVLLLPLLPVGRRHGCQGRPSALGRVHEQLRTLVPRTPAGPHAKDSNDVTHKRDVVRIRSTIWSCRERCLERLWRRRSTTAKAYCGKVPWGWRVLINSLLGSRGVTKYTILQMSSGCWSWQPDNPAVLLLALVPQRLPQILSVMSRSCS